jgi:FkbM family methyltransferase
MIADVPVAPIISFAQNREDVVLWRALSGITDGRYVEVGANHPTDDSVTRLFYDAGWSGITVEPEPGFADLQRTARPRDTLVEAAVGTAPDGKITLHVVPGTGLSTTVDDVIDRHLAAGIDHVDIVVPVRRLDDILTDAGWEPDQPIHFLLVDVEGAEDDVLASLDLTQWRPWVLVIESTAPNSTVRTHDTWEPGVLAADYEFCLFDGLSRFYVAAERADELREALGYPACILDNAKPLALSVAEHELQELRAQVVHWRTLALTQWADALAEASGRARAGGGAEADQLRGELEAIQQTLSWRITRPLRMAKSAVSRVRRR